MRYLLLREKYLLQILHGGCIADFPGLRESNCAQGIIPLYFTKKAAGCYLVEYSLEQGGPKVTIVDRIANPTGILEINSIEGLSSSLSKNSAKNFLTSGHKVVIQGEALTHLDRREDENVFGPSIDTIILSDIAAAIAENLQPKSILDIGCGSGHISCVVTCVNNETLSKVGFVDVHPTAVMCTHRNLADNLKRQSKKKVDIVGYIGDIKNVQIRGPFDLVVCNPPYVAIPPHYQSDDTRKFAQAVIGESLMDKILCEAHKLLSPEGLILMMVSSTSLGYDDLVSKHATSFDISVQYSGKGLKVPFDVDAILSDQKWLEFLKDSNGIIEEKGRYFHYLQPTTFKLRR